MRFGGGGGGGGRSGSGGGLGVFEEGEVVAFFGDLVAVFGGGGEAGADFHFVFEVSLLEGDGEEAADSEEFGGLEVGAFGGEDGVGHFLDVGLGEEGVGLRFAAVEIEVFGEVEGLGGFLGESAEIGVAGMEGVERLDGDAEVVAILVARLSDAGAGGGVGFAFEEAGGEGFLFGEGDRIEGFLAAEFHKYGVRVGEN